MKSELRFRSDVVPKIGEGGGGMQHFGRIFLSQLNTKVLKILSVPIPITIPFNRGVIPAIFPGSRPNRDRGKKNPEYSGFPIPAISGSGKSRLFSRPNRGGAGGDSGISGVLLNGITHNAVDARSSNL